MRYNVPDATVLRDFTAASTIYDTIDIADEQIWQAKINRPTHTVLTVSRKAADRVNRVVLDHAFENAHPLTDVPLESELETMYPFKGLNVMITKNLDKATGVVNGQVATIIGNEGRTLLLQFPNKKKTFTYPVTTLREDETWRTA